MDIVAFARVSAPFALQLAPPLSVAPFPLSSTSIQRQHQTLKHNKSKLKQKVGAKRCDLARPYDPCSDGLQFIIAEQKTRKSLTSLRCNCTGCRKPTLAEHFEKAQFKRTVFARSYTLDCHSIPPLCRFHKYAETSISYCV